MVVILMILMMMVAMVIMVMLVLVNVVDGDAFWTIVVGVGGGDNVDGDRGDDGGGRWCIR